MSIRLACPSCGTPLQAHNPAGTPLCGICWAAVPRPERVAVMTALKATAARPTNRDLAADYAAAVADAIGAIR